MIRFKKEDFELFDRKSRYTRYTYFRLFRKESEDNSLRVGVIVTKKAGNAVFRNRVRRVVFEFFRKNEGSIRNFKYLIIIDSKKIDRESLEKDLVENLSKLLSS